MIMFTLKYMLFTLLLFYAFFRGNKGRGGGGIPDKQLIAAGALGGALLLYLIYNNQYREITMKEFFQTYLSSGSVS